MALLTHAFTHRGIAIEKPQHRCEREIAKFRVMTPFLKPASAMFAAGVVCGAGALSALAPTPNDTTASTAPRPQPAAIVTAAAIPCKQQVWPIIDRRCMRWTAEGWTAPKADPNRGAGSNGGVNPEIPAARASEEPLVVAQAGRPAQNSPSPPVESRGVVRPTTGNAHHGRRAVANLSERAQHRKKISRKSQVARSRERDGDDRDYWHRRDYGYQAYDNAGHRQRPRMTGGWRNDGLAPRAGFEPATNRLTAGCSTTELPGNAAAMRRCGRV